jgi:hypothetical protein
MHAQNVCVTMIGHRNVQALARSSTVDVMSMPYVDQHDCMKRLGIVCGAGMLGHICILSLASVAKLGRT